MISGRVVVIVNDRLGLGDHLGELGATVFGSFEAAAAASAEISAVVFVPEVAPAALPLAETTEAEWDAHGESQLRAALITCQAAFTHLRERGGRIILVTPTAGLVGAAGFVPIATAGEGMRALAKSAARQWGRHGITVNCVAPALSLLGADAPPGVDPPALARAATVEDLARTIAVLASDAAGSFTGATIPVDGGVVMLS